MAIDPNIIRKDFPIFKNYPDLVYLDNAATSQKPQQVIDAVSIPVIASGGAGTLEDFYTIFAKGNADAALAASVFHFGQFTIRDVKKYLREKGIAVRL